jgi:hypothetical protein
MNIFNIIEEIEKVDPEISDRLNPRREALKNITKFGSKVAIASLPFAFGSMFKKAYGATPSAILDVLNFALTLEYLECNFYKAGLAQAPIPAGADRNAIQIIYKDESAHVQFLQSAIINAGGTPVAEAQYDFTAKGTFPTVFSDYKTFLAVGQVFEDTGVRAYKGQAGNLLGNKVYLTAALNIHSVEARHASHLRQMRMNNGFVFIEPWINGANDSGVPAADGNYAGEDNTVQAGIQIVGINGFTPIDKRAASESFDEPLTKDQVLALVKPFIK